jgi:hypothetical protein
MPRGHGPKAKPTGAKRGESLPIVIYPREKTKQLIVKAAEKEGLSVSRFVLLTVVTKIVGRAKLRKALPPDEYDTVVLNKYGATGKK